MISTMVYQLMKNATLKELEEAGLTKQYVEHGLGIYPMDANGIPFNANTIAITGDPLVDLMEDMAAEEKARCAYEHLMTLTTDPNLLNPLSFLRQREVVHFERFKELRDEYINKGYK